MRGRAASERGSCLKIATIVTGSRTAAAAAEGGGGGGNAELGGEEDKWDD